MVNHTLAANQFAHHHHSHHRGGSKETDKLLESINARDADYVREHIKQRIPALEDLITEMDDATVIEFVSQFERIVQRKAPEKQKIAQENEQRETPPPQQVELDTERVAFRLDGIELYALVVSLTAGFGFSSLEMISDEEMAQLGFPLTWIFMVTTALTVLSGLYATIVFSLCSMYAKTAIGSNRDYEMTIFLKETGIYRMRAFHHFLISIACFAINVLIICLVKFGGSPFGKLCFLACGWLLYEGWRDTQGILRAAAPIFAPPSSSTASTQKQDSITTPAVTSSTSSSLNNNAPPSKTAFRLNIFNRR